MGIFDIQFIDKIGNQRIITTQIGIEKLKLIRIFIF
jgi:hypothetical protein